MFKMKKWTLFLILGFCAGMVVPLFSQNNRTNPFEVSSRIQNTPKAAEADTTVTDTTRAAVSDNPFEVNHVPLRRQQFKPVQKAIEDISKVKPKVSTSFIFWIMIFSWAMLAIVISHKTSLLGYLLRSMFNLNMMKLTKRDEASGYNFHFALLYLCFFVNLSVFIYLLQKNYGGQEGIKIWLWCFFAVCGIYLLRHAFMWLLGALFPVSKESSLYSYIILVFNILLGLLIVPVNLMLAYGPEAMYSLVLYMGVGAIVLFYIMRTLRGLSISIFLIGQGIVPFFIYLCTAEIAPVLVMIRAISAIQG